MQSIQVLLCPLAESLDTIDCVNGKQMICWNTADAQKDKNLHIPKTPEDIFTTDEAQLSRWICILSRELTLLSLLPSEKESTL